MTISPHEGVEPSNADHPPGFQTQLVQGVWALGPHGAGHSTSEPSPHGVLCALPSLLHLDASIQIFIISVYVFNL